MPTLFVLSGPDIGRTFELGDGAVLGRSPECEAPLRGASVSRRHARLEARGADWFLVDLGSRNGIRRGELREEELRLEDGGTLAVGDVELRFRLEVVGETAAPPPRAASRPSPSAAAVTAPAPDEALSWPAEDGPADGDSADGDSADEVGGADDDGIVFEDEELFDAPPPAPVAVEPEAPARPARGPAARPAPSRPAPDGPARPAGPSRAAERLARAGIRPRPGTEGGGVHDGGRPILQYSREASGGGLLSADLSQYPGWVRALAGLVALGLFVLLFWIAFRMASSLGERDLGGADAGLEAPLD
jgi:predicted component of type VI protein secretion system